MWLGLHQSSLPNAAKGYSSIHLENLGKEKKDKKIRQGAKRMLVLSCAALSVSSSRLPAVSTSDRLPAGSAGHLLLDRRTALRLPFAAAVSAAAALRPSPAAAIDLTLDVSGLRWADIRQGVGGVPRDGERVTVDYMMTRNIGVTPMAGGKIYSTKDSQQPFSWVLGDGSVIEGLDMAVLGRGGIPPMKPGGIRRVLIPQQLGYGVGRGVFQARPPRASTVAASRSARLRTPAADPCLRRPQDNTAARVGVRSLLPVPPVGFEWRDKQEASSAASRLDSRLQLGHLSRTLAVGGCRQRIRALQGASAQTRCATPLPAAPQQTPLAVGPVHERDAPRRAGPAAGRDPEAAGCGAGGCSGERSRDGRCGPAEQPERSNVIKASSADRRWRLLRKNASRSFRFGIFGSVRCLAAGW